MFGSFKTYQKVDIEGANLLTNNCRSFSTDESADAVSSSNILIDRAAVGWLSKHKISSERRSP